MAFKSVNPQVVVGDILDEFRRSGITYSSSNSKARSLSSILARELQSQDNFFRRNFDKAFARYSRGDLLEAIALLLGVEREKATVASSYTWEQNVQFYVRSGNFGDINGGSSFTIPVGERIWTGQLNDYDEPIYYTLTTPLLCEATSSVAYANVEADGEGSGYNVGAHTLTEHSFITYTDFASESLLVKNNFSIINGQDRESDDELQYRLANAHTANEAANQTALRIALLSVPGIIDTKIISYYDGIGTSGAFVTGQGNQTTTSMLLQAQAALDQEVADGNRATAYMPPNVGVSFVTRVNLSEQITVNEQNEIQAALNELVGQYILNVRIGVALDLRMMLGRMLKVDSRILSFGVNPSTTPFDELYIYRTSVASGERVRSNWLDMDLITPKKHEVILAETSVTNPFQFNWQVYN